MTSGGSHPGIATQKKYRGQASLVVEILGRPNIAQPSAVKLTRDETDFLLPRAPHFQRSEKNFRKLPVGFRLRA